MAMIDFKVPAPTFKELDRRYKATKELIKDVKDRTKLMKKMKRHQVSRWTQNYRTQGGEYVGWERSSQTAQDLRGGSTLMRTGETFDYFQESIEKAEINATSLAWTFRNKSGGSAGPNGRPHGQIVSFDAGYDFWGGRVEPRILWDIDDEDEDRMADEVYKFLDEQAAKAGF